MPARLLVLVAAALLAAAAPVWAVSNGKGDLIVSFDGALSPTKLPRDAPAPVAVRVAGDVRSASGDIDALPQLRRIAVAINRQGQLFDRGLPVCRVREIQPVRQRTARRVCGDALVGKGSVAVRVRVPNQPPFAVKANLLAFNGPRRDGRRLILAQAYARKPPGSFILTFEVSHRAGTFGTVLSTTLPTSARRWAYLTHFDMTLDRTYTHRGQRRSYISAACAAPAGFSTALFPFARATYSFADGQQFTMSEAASCRVAGSSQGDRR